MVNLGICLHGNELRRMSSGVSLESPLVYLSLLTTFVFTYGNTVWIIISEVTCAALAPVHKYWNKTLEKYTKLVDCDA